MSEFDNEGTVMKLVTAGFYFTFAFTKTVDGGGENDDQLLRPKSQRLTLRLTVVVYYKSRLFLTNYGCSRPDEVVIAAEMQATVVKALA